MKICGTFFLFYFAISVSAFAQSLPQQFNFDGVLVDNSGNPLPSPVSSIKFQIFNPAENCLLFEETHSSVILDTVGAFSLKVGSGTRNSAADGGTLFSTIFQNSGSIRGVDGTYCPSLYTPTALDGRKLKITVDGIALSPSYDLSPTPQALVAGTLQGKSPSDFVSSSDPATQSVTGTLQVGGDLKIGNTGTSCDGSYVGALSYNAGLYVCDGSSWQTVGGGASGITSLNGLTASTQTFSTGATGTSPNWQSSSSMHTLNIPMASTASVTAGLISNSEYLAFQNKISSVTGVNLSDGMIIVGNGGTSTAVAPSGDLSMSNTGLFTLNPTPVTAGEYGSSIDIPVIEVDAAGRVIAASTTPVTAPPPTSVQALNGSAVSPSYSFSADTDSGIFSSANDILAISTGGMERLRIGTNGEVGIGGVPFTNTALHIIRPTNPEIKIGPTSGYAGRVGFATTAGQISGGTSANSLIVANDIGALHFGTSTSNPSTVRMTITSDGKVGVGTSTPMAKLHVAGAIVGGFKDEATFNIDWTLANVQTVPTCNSFNMNGTVDGGIYRLVVLDGSTPTACLFGGFGARTLHYPGGAANLTGVSGVNSGTNPILLTFVITPTKVLIEATGYNSP